LRPELISFAKFFHGHIGPFLALGMKAGLLAVLKCGRDPLRSHAQIKLPLRRPISCFIDGFQLITGCTVGKLNLSIVDSENDTIEVDYVCNERRVKIVVRNEFLVKILEELRNFKDLKVLAYDVISTNDEDIFIVS